MKHPNAAVAAGGSSLSVVVVWLLGHFHVALSAEDGAAVAGIVAAAALFVGRNGLRGVWRRIMDGENGNLTLIELVILATFAVALVIAWKVV